MKNNSSKLCKLMDSVLRIRDDFTVLEDNIDSKTGLVVGKVCRGPRPDLPNAEEIVERLDNAFHHLFYAQELIRRSM
jgi:hypothetical protein